MDWDEDWDDFDDEDLDEVQERATIAPMPDEIWDTLVLMRLEAGVLSEEDLPGLEWEDLPEMPEPMEPRDDAMHLALMAYDVCLEDPEMAAEMAEHAIDLDPHCIEGWVALWFTMDITDYDALVTAGKGVVYGHQLLTATEDVRFVTDIWQYPRIRGAVRAYAALALTNWAQFNEQDAFEAAEEVLRLTPDDPLDMAAYLANWYLTQGHVKRAYRLLREINTEGNAALRYAEALVEFARKGPEKAKSKLLTATTEHPLILGAFVSAGEGVLPPVDEPYPFHVYTPGSFEDAAVWYEPISRAWNGMEGALDWALQCAKEPQFRRIIDAAIAQTTAELKDITDLLGALGDIDFDDDDDDFDTPDLRLL